jgi:hypothetical protein
VTDELGPIRYRSADEDSARWIDFPFRRGDIVISTRSKSGTTWMQMICALLVFQTPDLPTPLGELSPWLDWLVVPREEIYARLAAQRHRRFIKTHTPLDGLPLDPRATYIVVARDPLDAAVSLYHQGDNLDHERIGYLTGQAPTAKTATPRPPIREWLVDWIHNDADPRAAMDSLPGFLWHLSDAWQRRDQPNIVLAHYDDLSTGLDAEMRRLAGRLGIAVDEDRWPELVAAARFTHMRARANLLAPDPALVMKDRSRFFRRGSSGAGRELLTAEQMASYHSQIARLAQKDLARWLHPG